MLFNKEKSLLKTEDFERYKIRALFSLTFALFGFVLLFLGFSFNYTAITSNGYKMPTLITGGFAASSFEDEGHFGFYNYKDIKYPLYADIFPLELNPDIFHYTLIVFSMGDLLMVMGLLDAFLMLCLETHSLFKFGIWKFGRKNA